MAKMPRESKERNVNGLTAREQTFCDEYLKCGSTYEAALKLGYKKTYADKIARSMYNRPQVQDYLQRTTANLEDTAIATTKELQRELTAIVRCETKMHEPVNRFVGGGVQEIETVEREPNGKERLDAIEKLLKIQGAYNKDINVNVKPVVIHDDLDDAPIDVPSVGVKNE